jgi:YHS domain-containing protein
MQTAQLPPTAVEQPAANPSSVAAIDVDTPTEAQAPEIYNAPAFGGLCLAGVRETRSLISGMPQLAMQYRGRTLYFSSPEQQQNFRDNPSKYWPEQDGICPVSLVDNGEAQEGKLEFAAMYKGRLWVTSSESAMQKFVAEPARYVTAASQARQ